MAGRQRDVPALRWGEAQLHQHSLSVDLPRVQNAVLYQDRNDLRGQPAWLGQVVARDLVARQREERHQLVRTRARAWRDAENGLVYAVAHSPCDADQELRQADG